METAADPSRGEHIVGEAPVPMRIADTEPPADRPRDLAGRSRGSMRFLAAAIPVVVVVAILASVLTSPAPTSPGSPRTVPSGGSATTAQRIADAPGAPTEVLPPLPAGLAFITAGLDGGRGGGLHLVVTGQAPMSPFRGRSARSFRWSPDGSHLAVQDDRGWLRLLPEGTRIRGPIRSYAFSHGGDRIAVCSGGRVPRLTVRVVAEGLRPLFPAVTGCDPAWSADDTYVSYRIPGPGARVWAARVVLNTHLGVRFRLPGTGPVAWAPATGYAFSPVTTLADDCQHVQVMDPRGGRPHVIALLPELRPVDLSPRSACPVKILAWSPDARWLAVAIAAGPGWPELVLLFEPLVHALIDLPVAGMGLTPTSLSWSPDGRELLVGGNGPQAPMTVQAAPDGGRVLQRLSAGSASWSADGAWILAHDAGGWAAFRASDVAHRVPVAVIPADAPAAGWCCPPVEVVVRPTVA